MNDTNKDYKRMWFTYKQALLDEFKSMCKEAVYITAELGALKDMPIQNTVLKERKKIDYQIISYNGNRLLIF